MVPIDFQVTCSKVNIRSLFWAQFVVCSISFDPFTCLIPNVVQGLLPISRWLLLIFWPHVQRSRSNHSSQPTMLSTLYILIPCLLASDSFCFYREEIILNFAPWGAYISEKFLVRSLSPTKLWNTAIKPASLHDVFCRKRIYIYPVSLLYYNYERHRW